MLTKIINFLNPLISVSATVTWYINNTYEHTHKHTYTTQGWSLGSRSRDRL